MAKPLSGYVPRDSIFPLRGINTFTPSNLLDPRLSPELNNVLETDGIIEKRCGYAQLGDDLDKNGIPVTDLVLALVEFIPISGPRTLVAFTTKRQYRLDFAGLDWKDVTLRTLPFTIDGVDTGTDTFTISGDGDLSTEFPDGGTFVVEASSGNDGTFTVISTSFSDPDFNIVVAAIPSPTVSGTIAAHIEQTGTEDDVYDFVQATDDTGKKLIATNGKDPIIFWDGLTPGFELLDMQTFPNFVTAKTLEAFFDHLTLGDINDLSSNPQLFAFSDAANFEEWNAGDAGAVVLSNAQGEIKKLLKLGDLLVAYSRNSIELIRFIGAPNIYAIEHAIDNVLIPSPRSIVDLGVAHVYMSRDNFYLYSAGREVIPVGDPVKKSLQKDLDSDFINRAFGFHDKNKQRIFFFVPTGAATGKFYIANYNIRNLLDTTWTIIEFTDYTPSLALFSQEDNITWDSKFLTGLKWTDLVPTWEEISKKKGTQDTAIGGAGKVFFNDLVKNDDGVPFEGVWESVDFVVPREFESTFGRWIEIEHELRGTCAEIEISLDHGLTFTFIETVTLTSEFVYRRTFIDVATPSLRIRIKSDLSGSDFELRFLRVWFHPQGVRVA